MIALICGLSCPGARLYAADAVPMVSVATDTSALAENSPQAARVTFSRTGSIDGALRVFLQFSGDARQEIDFRGIPSEVVFAPGQESVTYNVSPVDNSELTPDKTLTIAVQPPLRPFSIVILPDTQYYTSLWGGGLPEMFTAQTRWTVEHKAESNIAFVLHEGDCTDQNTPAEWQRVKKSMSVLDGLVPYAIAAGNHDGLMTSRTDTELFNQYFPLTNYTPLVTFGGYFEPNRMDNVYHTFSAGGIDWLVLALEFGPRDEVLAWANSVVASNSSRKVIIVTHAHVYTDNTLHGSDPSHAWTPRSYGRVNDGVDVWEKLVRKHANMAFVFNGHVLNNGQGRLIGVGDHGNRVYQMLCNFQTWQNGGSGFMRVIKMFPGEDRLEARTFSPYTGADMIHPCCDFTYTNLGIFAGVSNTYAVAAQAASVTLTIANDEVDLIPPAVTNVSAQGIPAEITVRFNEAVDAVTATNVGNYSVPGVPLESARLLSDGATVVLTAAARLASRVDYSLQVNGIADASPQRNTLQLFVGSFTYTPLLMADAFGMNLMDGWRIADEGDQQGPSNWSIQRGQLAQNSNIFGTNSSPGWSRRGTYAIWDNPGALSWSNYTLLATLQSSDNDGIGLLFRYRDSSNYYKFEMDAERSFRKLSKLVAGVETVIACDTNRGYIVGAQYDTRIELAGNSIRIALNDQPVFPEVIDEALAAGSIALYCWGNSGASFANIRTLPSYQRPFANLTSPGANQLFFRGTNILVSLNVSDPDGMLDRVELLDRGLLLARLASPLYSFIIRNAPTRDYFVSARVTDIFGLARYSPPLPWRVIDPAPPPVMIVQPQSRSVAEGSGAILWGRAESLLPVRYRWAFNGAPIPGATNSALLFEAVRQGDAGTYTLSAISLAGAVSSEPATLSIVAPLPSGSTSAAPVTLATETILDDGRLVISINSAPFTTVSIEGSQDLQTWTSVGQVTNVADRAYFIDPRDRPQRFYRARVLGGQ